MAVGPQSPPGSPPRPRQVIIPAGAVDEHETTVLDVPPTSPLEQPQRVIIPPGTVHADETTVVVVPAPRLLASAPGPVGRYEEIAAAIAAAEAERERERFEAERLNRERVRQAKLAFAAYLQGRTDPESIRLRRTLLMEADPAYEPYTRFTEAEARRAEQDLWNADLEDIPDPEQLADAQPYRLQMSMNIEEFPGPPPVPTGPPSPAHYWSPRQTQRRFTEALDEYGELSDIEVPESLYGEDAGWEPPPPPPPLIAPPPEEEVFPPIISPPRYVYQRDAPHDPGDLMWEWDEPPRPVFEPPILPEPEPYSAELFRLVRM